MSTPPPAESFGAVLLAAGAGRRMGGCKALLDLGGRPALSHALDALRDGGVESVRVVLGHQAHDVKERVDLSGCDVVVNPQPERGQTSSLRAGLALAPWATDAWLLHTVDHPLVEASDVAALLAAWKMRDAQTEILAPSTGSRRGHPVVFAAALAREFEALGDEDAAHQVIRRNPERVQHLVLASPWLVHDLDTPDDLAAARQALAARG